MPGSAAVAVDYVYEVVENDGTPLDPLPLNCSDFADVLTGTGQLNATIARSHAKANRVLINPLGRELVVSRNGAVCWNGPITWVQRSRRAQVTTIRAHQLQWYLYNARLETDYTATSTDLFTIVRDLITIALGKTGGARFAFSVTAGAAGVTKTVDYLGAERQSIGQIIEDLATDPVDGFDFRLTLTGTCAADITRTFELGAPSLGTAIVSRKLQPGGGLYDLIEEADIERAGNRVHLLPGIGPTLTLTNSGSLGAGDPSIETVLNRPDLDGDSDIAAGVVAELRRLAQPPVRLYKATYLPRADLPYDWCAPGDTVQLADPDVDIDDTRRVGSILTRPPRTGQGEQVDLALNLPLDELGT